MVEFKVGESRFLTEDLNQCWDYALDLKNFHEGSATAEIFPLLVATQASSNIDTNWPAPHADGVRPPRKASTRELRAILNEISRRTSDNSDLDGQLWGASRYKPTPTIIEAARALYARHSVDSIARNDAGAVNLALTSDSVARAIDYARKSGTKAIVFVTGVPGAGKTLVGLSIATERRGDGDETHAVYLSGNKPLVDVLREALTRDEVERLKKAGQPARKGAVAQKVKPFIQNVHHFRDEGLRDESAPPVDHVVIFDEAQRAWNLEQTSKFMREKKGRPNFDQTEPEFLLGYMDRHTDWAVVVCLVGGGQEINTGESGIASWFAAASEKFAEWQIYISPNLIDKEYSAVEAIESIKNPSRVLRDDGLHLKVSMRSFRAESVSGFVKSLLDGETKTARQLRKTFDSAYPIAITRDLHTAKAWIKKNARGTERYGLVASSNAQRLKPHAIDIRVAVDPVKWFLNDAVDTRSSYYLEDAATEFQIQGLELDWICMSWDADLRRTQSGWSHHAFRGVSWTNVIKSERQQYLLNAYRVLLTRARQGMVIFVPSGEENDPTRRPEFYDRTYKYLVDVGLHEI